MGQNTKIATCCYCGRRQALQLTARGGHELACGSCGAPLHEMKWLKPPVAAQPKKRSPPRPAPHPAPHPAPETRSRRDDDSRKRPSAKRRKPLWKRALAEVFDEIEDLFD